MESNPFLAPNNDLGQSYEVSGSESRGSVSTVRAAVCAWLGTALGGAAFGFIGFVFGMFFGFVIALVVALPITLLVFTSLRLLGKNWQTRNVLLLAAAMSGGLTGLVSTFLLFGGLGIAQTLSTLLVLPVAAAVGAAFSCGSVALFGTGQRRSPVAPTQPAVWGDLDE